MSTPGLLYFGCGDKPGHYWWSPDGSSLGIYAKPFDIDGVYAPWLPKRPWEWRAEEAPQGEAALVSDHDHTILAFWDRSVDRRGACNSAFVAPGRHTFDAMISAAREQFPWVWARLPFEVTLRVDRTLEAA